jgi:hypothetical protein
MPTKRQQMQSFIRHYKDVTGSREWDMHDVAKMAADLGWKLPAAPTPLDLLAKEFSEAAREETRVDVHTGQRYRANHAFIADAAGQTTLWVDIDEAPRNCMLKSAVNRREQVVGDLVQLTLDLGHWNRMNPGEDPIDVPLDFTDDVQWRLNGGAGSGEAA